MKQRSPIKTDANEESARSGGPSGYQIGTPQGPKLTPWPRVSSLDDPDYVRELERRAAESMARTLAGADLGRSRSGPLGDAVKRCPSPSGSILPPSRSLQPSLADTKSSAQSGRLVGRRWPALEDIIKSKKAANRAKDRESLPRLEAFLQYLKERGTERQSRRSRPRRLDREVL